MVWNESGVRRVVSEIQETDVPMTEAGGHSSTKSGELDNSKVTGEHNLTC